MTRRKFFPRAYPDRRFTSAIPVPAPPRPRPLDAIREAIIEIHVAHCIGPDTWRSSHDVEVVNASSDGGRFDVVYVYRAGQRHCCHETGCTFSVPPRLEELRERLVAVGWTRIPRMRIGRIFVRIEEGAMDDALRKYGEAGAAGPSLEIIPGPFREPRSSRSPRPRWPVTAWDPLVMRGCQARNAGRLRAAIGILRQAVRAQPQLHEGWHHLADCLMRAGLVAEAERASTRAIRRDPRHAEDWFRRSRLRRKQGRIRAADRDLERVLTLGPDFLHGWLMRGRLNFARRRWEEAESDFTRGMKVGSRNHEARSWRAWTRLATGNERAAAADFLWIADPKKGRRRRDTPLAAHSTTLSRQEYSLKGPMRHLVTDRWLMRLVRRASGGRAAWGEGHTVSVKSDTMTVVHTAAVHHRIAGLLEAMNPRIAGTLAPWK